MKTGITEPAEKPKPERDKIGPDGYCSGERALARILGFHFQTIRKWRRNFGDTPEKHKDGKKEHVQSWRDFIALKGLGETVKVAPKERELLMRENLEKKNKLLDIDIAKAEGKVRTVAEVKALMLSIASKQNSILRQKLENEFPGKLKGLNATEIRAEGRKLADRLCDIFSDSTAAFLDE